MPRASRPKTLRSLRPRPRSPSPRPCSKTIDPIPTEVRPTVIFGTDPHDGKMFLDHSVDTFARYCGAVKQRDGWGGMNAFFGNLIRGTAEINVSTGSARARAVFPLFFG